MPETDSFGLVGDKPIDTRSTSLGIRRPDRWVLEQRQVGRPIDKGLGEAGARLTFVPAAKIHNGIGWDDPESTHGVVDGLAAIPRDWR